MKNYFKKNYIYLLGALAGCALFLLIYGAKCLVPTFDSWILNGYVETDITQRYRGWLAYRNSATFFPLTFTRAISYPFGAPASLADSIPLALVIFKILSPILPATFQYEGLLMLLNFALQGYFATRLAQHFTDNRIKMLLFSLLMCLSPIFLERAFRHTSLSFHWLLLWGLCLYFDGRKEMKSNTIRQFVVLSALSVGIHLYFTPMIVGLFLAAILDGEKKRTHFALFGADLVLCFVIAKLFGLMDMGLGNNMGYGYMGMNLNALFNPVSLGPEWWVPGKGQIKWSIILPVRALTLNNLESFNYLGLGVLICLAVVIITVVIGLIKDRNSVFEMVKGHLFLVLFSLFCFIFAISNTVCAFSYQLFTIPLPEKIVSLLSAFRRSGRLFWAVNYLLVTVAFFGFARLFKNEKVSTVLLCAVLLVQAVDMLPAISEKRGSISDAPYSAQQLVDETDGADVCFFLEYFDDRALCCSLLKEGKSNNLAVISRGTYGVDSRKDAIDKAKVALLDGTSVFENTVYVTKDTEYIEKLKDVRNLTLAQAGEYTVIRVN